MKSPTILLVEDNPITRKMMRVTLTTAGYSVVEAAEGETAFERAADGPDLIVMDLLLPDADGLELARRIRTHPRGAEIPIICCSGFLPKVEQASRLGTVFTDYLFKPVEPWELLQAVERCLPSRSPASDHHGAGRRVLLADDDPLQLKLAKVHFERAGFTVTTAADGLEALQIARVSAPDVIVSDVLMPHSDGFSLSRAVRQDPGLTRVPVVLISSVYLEEADRELARMAGAQALLMRTADCAEAIEAALASLTEPLAELSPVAEHVREKYLERVLTQLERHANLNQNLLNRLALGRVGAAVLVALAETLNITGDLRTVVDDTIFRCLDAAGVSRGLAYLLEPGGELTLALKVGFAESAIPRLLDLFGRSDLLRRVMQSPKPIELNRQAGLADRDARLLEECEAQSILIAPFSTQARCEGVMVLASSRKEFGEGWEEFVKVVGVQLALALRLMRALADTERRRREAEVLAEVASRISASFDRDTILQRVAEGAKDLCHCDHAIIALREPGSEAMVFRYWAGARYAGYANLRIELGKGSGGWVLATGQPFRTDDYAADARITKDYLEVIRANQVMAQLVVPIRIEQRIEGLLYAENLSSRPFTDEDEAVLFQLATHAAIAIRNVRHREVLNQTEKLAAMGQLLAGVAHELNNPLSVVLGNIAMMRRPASAESMEPRIDKIQKATERCARLVKSFLALARQHPPERRAMSINVTVREAVELLGYQLRVDDVQMILNMDEAVPSIWADPHQLHQVVVNLLTNAHHALRTVARPRCITITTRHDPVAARVQLEVTDSGPGIPVNIQAQVFEPFFTTKPAGEGTGLGLSLCAGIVQEHGGVVHLESEPGKTVFRVDLPVGTPEPGWVEARSGEPIREVTGKRILVVDDEPEVASTLSDLLSAAGHHVEIAENGAIALTWLADRDVDAILSDIRMPDLDGPGLYRALERQKPDLLRRFIFITGDTLSAGTREWLEKTNAPCVSKPFDLDDIQRALCRVLEEPRR